MQKTNTTMTIDYIPIANWSSEQFRVAAVILYHIRMKVHLLFHACLLFCCVVTFVAFRKYDALLVISTANSSRNMAITHIAYVTDETKKRQQLTLSTLSDVPAIEKLIERTTLPRETEQRSDAIGSFVKSEKDRFNKTYSDFPEMEKALECLRQSKPDLPNISYPPDALEHFNHIHDRLRKWVQKPKHRPHRAVKYRGPWIENRWITHFQKDLNQKISLSPISSGPTFPSSSPGRIYGWRINFNIRGS